MVGVWLQMRVPKPHKYHKYSQHMPRVLHVGGAADVCIMHRSWHVRGLWFYSLQEIESIEYSLQESLHTVKYLRRWISFLLFSSKKICFTCVALHLMSYMERSACPLHQKMCELTVYLEMHWYGGEQTLLCFKIPQCFPLQHRPMCRALIASKRWL